MSQFENGRETIRYLLDQGASINAHYSAGMNPTMRNGDDIMYGTFTALDFAIASNQADLVFSLLARGARLDLRGPSAWTNGQQMNGIELARMCGHDDLVIMLEDWVTSRACP